VIVGALVAQWIRRGQSNFSLLAKAREVINSTNREYMNTMRFFALSAIAALTAISANAAVITFTGGTVVRQSGPNQTTNNGVTWDNVDYYEEAGFRLDFKPNGSATAGFATNVGDYYGAGNDVIHAHWATGNFGGVTQIEITKVGGGTFDLNYFVLTSNTDTGGAPASGNEMAFVEGFLNNVSTGVVRLPSEDWGFPATQIFLSSVFDVVDSVRFYVTNPVDCFGMDSFYIDEAPPPSVPEPGSLALVALALGCLLTARKKNQ
jgi:hypothetical protein